MRAQRVPAQAWEEVLILAGNCLIDKERTWEMFPPGALRLRVLPPKFRNEAVDPLGVARLTHTPHRQLICVEVVHFIKSKANPRPSPLVPYLASLRQTRPCTS
jgi:hypothetical protein